VLALAQRCGLSELVASKLTLPAKGGVNAHLKVPGLVGGMVAGADSIDDMDVLRHGGMNRLFGGVRAPSTLGTFLRSFTFGHVRQLDSVAAELLVELARRSPVLAGADQVGYVDIGDTVKAAAAGAVVLVGLPGAGPSRVAFTATARGRSPPVTLLWRTSPGAPRCTFECECRTRRPTLRGRWKPPVTEPSRHRGDAPPVAAWTSTARPPYTVGRSSPSS